MRHLERAFKAFELILTKVFFPDLMRARGLLIHLMWPQETLYNEFPILLARQVHRVAMTVRKSHSQMHCVKISLASDNMIKSNCHCLLKLYTRVTCGYEMSVRSIEVQHRITSCTVRQISMSLNL